MPRSIPKTKYKPHLERRSKGARPERPTTRRIKTAQPETDQAQERGERIDTGKTIARGGKTDGFVPGATEQEP